MLSRQCLTKKIPLVFIIAINFLMFSACVNAQTQTVQCQPWAAKIVSLEGDAQARSPQRTSPPAWRALALGDYICPGEQLKILNNRAALELPNLTVVRVKAGSTIHFMKPKQHFLIELFQGALHFITRTPKDFKIKGPFLNAAIHGTEFLFEAEKTTTRLSLFEGQVTASNTQGNAALVDGQRVEATVSTPPKSMPKITLRHATQWALYYPPVLTPLKDSNAALALKAIERTPEDQCNHAYFNQLASLLLYQGKVELARQHLASAQAISDSTPHNKSEDTADTYALLAIVELITGNSAQAKLNAQLATEVNPNAPSAWIALSYIQQSEFDLEKARASAQRSLALAPDNALAQARLSELLLALGHYQEAITLAEQAAQNHPTLSRVQMILGFAYLSHFDLDKARSAFSEASTLDPSDPLPQLGLGLIEIRLGHLAKGRRLLELAVVLDPGNALIRSYLGKAYFEEQRHPLAATQFLLAKGLDPNDPTPWYYDGLRKHAENDPLAALEDLEQSEKLNDHRAVFRSRFLLDKDEASRSANSANIFQSLNYDEMSIQKSAFAATQAPSEHSAHRQLALAYINKPLYEDLRASERLKATLLQPIGTQPLPLGLDESGLITLKGAGPSDMGLNEYNPLFTQYGPSVAASALYGSNNTQAYQWQIGGFYKRGAFSLREYRYQSDGVRINNDVDYTIRSVLGQLQVAPGLALQAELKRRQDIQGDLAQRFSDAFIFEDLTLDKEVDTARVGLKADLSASSSILASFEREQLDRQTQNVLNLMLRPGMTIDINTNDMDDIEHHYHQVQYLNKQTHGHLTIGASQIQMDRIKTSTTLNPLVSPLPTTSRLDEDVSFHSVYVYQDINTSNSPHHISAGISYSAYETDRTDSLNINEDRWNPKMGYTWKIDEKTTFRSAAFKTHTAPDEANATLEPTHFAGFAQVFDDKEAAESEVFGLALDYKIRPGVTTGLQLTQRNIDVDIIIANLLRFETLEFEESLISGYVNAKLTDRWSLSTKYLFEDTQRQLSDASALLDVPVRLQTHIVPLSVNYNTPKGYSVEITGSFVKQTITQVTSLTYDTQEQSDPFFNVDLALKYQLPKRRGEVSIGIYNLFDETFQLEDRNIQNNDNLPRAQRFYPEMTALGKLNFYF